VRQLAGVDVVQDRLHDPTHLGEGERPVADAEQRHVQRARDRRRRKRQDVDRRAQLLEALFVHDAEPLFLVDDDQPEVRKHDVLLQQAVRADDDVDLAARDIA